MTRFKRLFVLFTSSAILWMAAAIEAGATQMSCQLPHSLGCALQCYAQWYGDAECISECINLPDDGRQVYFCEDEDPEEFECSEFEVPHVCDDRGSS